MLTLSGRTCVFAGATGEIGRGAVRAMAEQGMNVIMVTHNPERAGNIVADLCGLPGQVVAMSNEIGNEELFRNVYRVFGSVDAMISATGSLIKVAKPEDIGTDTLDALLHHQVTEVYDMICAALPYLEKSRAPRIVLTSSVGALNGFSGENIADTIARGAVVSMTMTLARALAIRGITVNCIARGGLVNDHPLKEVADYDIASIADRIPIGHIGTSEEYGAMVQYIVSEEAGFVTGHVFNLSGGLHIG